VTPPISAPDAIASPCISVCVMLPEAGVCAGCFRTLDEIAAWSALGVADRRAVLAALPARRERWEPLARSVRPGAPERDR
jgi:predicted Fe-S protein YdhL (DUF1289 family)